MNQFKFLAAMLMLSLNVLLVIVGVVNLFNHEVLSGMFDLVIATFGLPIGVSLLRDE
jgi:hypothetical protein